MNKLFFGILLLFVLSSSDCGRREKTIPPALKDKIVFLSSDGICTINPDGTDRKVVVPSDGKREFFNPKWSPSKREIAFTAYISLEDHRGRHRKFAKILIVNSDGTRVDTLGLLRKRKRKTDRKKTSELRVEQSESNVSFLDWSPDGKYLLFDPGLIDLGATGVMKRKGKVVDQRGCSYGSFIDANRVVCVGDYGGIVSVASDIFIFTLTKEGKQNLTNDGKTSYSRPVGSPDGKKLAFGSFPRTELWIMNSDGSQRRKLVSGDIEGLGLTVVAFSLGGNEILFVSSNGDRSKLYLINCDGTHLRAITDDIVKASGGVCCSPDGKQIVFTSNKDGNDELYVINIDGTGLRRLTNNLITDCCPDW